MHNEKTVIAGERTHYPTLSIRPFFGMQSNGHRAEDPTGYDVYEQTGPQTEAVISPCDTLDGAKLEMARIKALMKTETKIKPTIKHARKVLELVSHGLTSGIGAQSPGKMCVEAVVRCAFGLDHGDNPPCVGHAVRAFKIKLNDCDWPSDMDRAEGMKALAIAQLGSNELDQTEFGKLMFLRGTQKLLPFVWRKESALIKDKSKRVEMISWCEKMEKCETLQDAKQLARDAYAYASASVFASVFASVSASVSVSVSVSVFAFAFAFAYRHELLKLTAQVGLDVLIEMKSPGCKWLHLLKGAK